MELEIDFPWVPQFGHPGSPLIVTGTVTRATKLITNRGTQYQIAVEFHDITPKDMGVLIEYLDAHAEREENSPEIERAPLTTPLLRDRSDLQSNTKTTAMLTLRPYGDGKTRRWLAEANHALENKLCLKP